MDRIEQHEQHLPPQARRFPFKVLNESERQTINAAIGRAILNADNMLFEVAREIFPRVDRDTLEDRVQDTAGHLATVSLPRYDATKATAVSTYLYRCIRLRMLDIARREGRQKRRRHRYLDDVAQPAAPDTSADRAVEELAARIATEPEKFLTEKQADVVRTLAMHDGNTAAAREALNVSSSTFANIKVRAQQRCRELLADVA